MLLSDKDVREVTLLKDLPEEAVKAFIDLANNLHTTQIKDFKRTERDNLDKDILEATGIDKKRHEATHDYLKRSFGEKTQSLSSKIEELESSLGDGAGKVPSAEIDAIQKKYNDLEASYSALKADYSQLETEVIDKEKSYQNQLLERDFDQAALSALAELKPKAGYEVSFDELAKVRLQEIKSSYEIERNGDMLQYRKGEELLTNKQKSRRPMTTEDLVYQVLGDIAEPKQAGGAGGKGGVGKRTEGPYIGDAPSNRDEAYINTQKQLATEGIAVSSPEYQKRFDAVYESAIEILS